MAANDPQLAQLVIANAREYAIIVMSEDGVIESWSPGAELIFGYAVEQIIGRSISLLFAPSDNVAKVVEHELETAGRQGRAEDSRWHVRRDGARFWANGVTMALRNGSRPGFVKVMRDETRTRLADEQRVLLLNELNHRIKNNLAVVQSIAEQTLRAAGTDPQTRSALTNRLINLSEAHDVLMRENWAGAGLREVIQKAVGAHGGPDRFQLDGPPLRLSPDQAVSLSLAVHELATNALKYGALSAASGRVGITWNQSNDGDGKRYMNLLWRESGGPPVVRPRQTGFGTRLLTNTFSRSRGGNIKVNYHPDGLECVLALELSGPQEVEPLDLAKHGAGAETRSPDWR